MQLQLECLLRKSSTAPTAWRDARPAHLPLPCARTQSIIPGSQAKAATQHHHCRLCAGVRSSGSRPMTTAMRTVRHAQHSDGHGMFSQLCLADTHENLGAVTPTPHPPGRQCLSEQNSPHLCLPTPHHVHRLSLAPVRSTGQDHVWHLLMPPALDRMPGPRQPAEHAVQWD